MVCSALPTIACRHERSEMERIIHWFMVNASVLSVLVTVAITVLLVCCLKCSDCSHRERDDLFTKHSA